jgi:hypothetical protein
MLILSSFPAVPLPFAAVGLGPYLSRKRPIEQWVDPLNMRISRAAMRTNAGRGRKTPGADISGRAHVFTMTKSIPHTGPVSKGLSEKIYW